VEASSTAKDKERTMGTVHYSDIPERVQIVGRLGLPLGQLVTVRGKWIMPFPSKPASPTFIIDYVDGRLLNPPAEFGEVEPVEGGGGEISKRIIGEEWEIRGVETGGFVGFSDQVWAELGQPPAQRPPRGFLTRFCYLTVKRITGSTPIQ
jgi:hypothetical protein